MPPLILFARLPDCLTVETRLGLARLRLNHRQRIVETRFIASVNQTMLFVLPMGIQTR